MYWIDIPLSSDAKIEKASMDGKNRQCLHSVGMPKDLTLDYQTQVLYWYDYNRGTIESSSVDGSNRTVLLNLGAYLYIRITTYDGILYWSIGNIWSANVSLGQVMDAEVLLNLSVFGFCEYSYEIQVISEEKQYKCKP